MQLSAKELRVLEKFRDVNAKRKKTGSGAKDLVEPLLDSIIKDHLPLDHILYEYIYCVGTNLSRARLADSRWGTPSTAFASTNPLPLCALPLPLCALPLQTPARGALRCNTQHRVPH